MPSPGTLPCTAATRASPTISVCCSTGTAQEATAGTATTASAPATPRPARRRASRPVIAAQASTLPSRATRNVVPEVLTQVIAEAKGVSTVAKASRPQGKPPQGT